tara:strand:- start:9 stop:386 length:378 start_codon:yes stop_codon:yes gene_type:complete
MVTVLLLPQSVCSEDRHIVEYDNGRRDYIKYESVLRKRCGFSLAFKCRRFLELYDYLVPEARGHLSSEALVEYDCKKKIWRLIRINHYDQNMGEGNLLSGEEGEDKWLDITIDSREKQKFNFVCF